ncbi:hypothetical protein [Salinimonas chungwhensis]|uniref:hypothetical protein n=1 Tax=Salinimonas chungwhensis TaxID=265425 RepID=UPI00035C3793|nr:hypothetical protein [Salinimonas chungwhensis]
MKDSLEKIIKIVLILLICLLAVREVVFWVLPSVKIVNNSGSLLTHAVTKLPKSNLDFGSMENAQSNTIHYSLDQTDGEIAYQFTFPDGSELSGNCMYVTQNAVNERILINVFNDEVVCGHDS